MTESTSDNKPSASRPAIVPDRALIQAALREAIGVGEHASSAGRARAQELSQSSAELFATPASDSFPGYEITREIHRGGQGVVYQAIQKATRRKVAIKVMREGPFATPRDRVRFEREVQILSQLNHPSIVAVHDSGMVGQWSYHVMDYISGQPLDVFMASGARTIEDTMRLFLRICEAVNAAHLRGVIHRDLKPSNIRIDAAGQPHILDFGLAKITVPAATDESQPPVMTITGQFVGSLPWASPEQAEGSPEKIDIRTDVYSLGVVIYQMLTGRFPYEVVGNMRDVLDRIMKAEPVRPAAIRKGIDDETQTIVLKCLSKDRDRRYQSAGELGRDIAHYLAGEPIEAKRDSVGYLLRKQLRRYRLPVAVGAAFVVLLAAGLITSLTLWSRAAADRDRAVQAERMQSIERRAAEEARSQAQANQQRAEQESARLRAAMDLLGQIMTVMSGGLGFSTDQLTELDATDQRISREFQGDASVEAVLRVAMSLGYGNLQSVDRVRALEGAEREIRAAVDLHRQALGPSHPKTLRALMLNTFLHVNQRRFDEAEARAREVLDATGASYADESPEMVNAVTLLGHVLNQANRPEEALELHRRIQPVAIKVFGPRDSRTRTVTACIATDLVYAKRFQEAEDFLMEVYRDATAHAGEGTEATLHTLNLLIGLYRYWGKPEEAEKYDRISKELTGTPRPAPGS